VAQLPMCLFVGEQENMKVLADKWKNMTEARKRPYEMQAQVDARRYQTEVNYASPRALQRSSRFPL